MVFIHDPDEHADQAITVAYPVLEKMRDQGLVTAIGVGITTTAIPTRFVHETDIDVVLMALRYTLLDQSAAQDLLPAALEKGVSVIAGGVFNSGILINPNKDSTFNYTPASSEILHRAQLIQEFLGQRGVSLAQAAMQFPLRHPAISAILVGCRSRDEVLHNITDFNTIIAEDIWLEIEDFLLTV
jgi:D-threo-aldose 1-dehydrogenase